MKPLALLGRAVPNWISWTVMSVGLALVFAFLVRWLLPVYRVGQRSSLVMLGDFDGNHKWSKSDFVVLSKLLANPFLQTADECAKADVNNNGRIDPEDLSILNALFATGDPFVAEAKALENLRPFPRPRELYRYVSPDDYVNRPLFALPYLTATNCPLDVLRYPRMRSDASSYVRQLEEEIYDEAVRFDQAFRMRFATLTDVELMFCRSKLAECNRIRAEGRNYDLLLELISLVEDAETLTTRGQDRFVAGTLYFRDHLRGLLASKRYAGFETKTVSASEILKDVQILLKLDLGLDLDLEKLGPPRDLVDLRNYVSRTQWQFYKSGTRTVQFQKLIHFAQHDRRYLRAVSRTSRKHADPGVENHNLPMILLFREALRITGDKKAAVGLLDESIRMPFFWVKSIPRNKLPSSVALENFLLPGNMEDGADKSRHWNVFGGICLYKSPQESLDLALKREMQDLRGAGFTVPAVTEFIRDTIANLNGIYYVVTMNPDLLRQPGGK